MKLHSKEKNIFFWKGRKSELLFEVLFMVSFLGAIYFPSIERISRKKKSFQFSGFKAWQHFVISCSSCRQMKLRRVCQVSFFKTKNPGSLSSLILEKCLYCFPVSPGGVLCQWAKGESKNVFILWHNQLIALF